MKSFRILLSLILVFIVLALVSTPKNFGKITFTAVGDYGANTDTYKVLNLIDRIKPTAHLLLGDLSYDQVQPEAAWCAMIEKQIRNIPMLLIAGNHESNGLNGHIDQFIKCLPEPKQAIHGDYGKEYYVDFPEEKPLVRMIFVSADLLFSNGETHRFDKGTPHRLWIEKTIDDAKDAGIPWVITSMHKVCILAGNKVCEIGEEFTNYLLQNTDLILQGHAHMYQRSKQLSCVRKDTFEPLCVTISNKDRYLKGRGGVIVIAGTGGAERSEIDHEDKEVPYFEAFSTELGVAQVTVSNRALQVKFQSVNGELDAFEISR